MEVVSIQPALLLLMACAAHSLYGKRDTTYSCLHNWTWKLDPWDLAVGMFTWAEEGKAVGRSLRWWSYKACWLLAGHFLCCPGAFYEMTACSGFSGATFHLGSHWAPKRRAGNQVLASWLLLPFRTEKRDLSAPRPDSIMGNVASGLPRPSCR